MRAVVLCAGDCPVMSAMAEHYPIPLLPVGDRPFLRHVVEYLIHHDVKELDFLLCRFPEKIEEMLGDGERWGAKFRFHLIRDAQQPYRMVKTITYASVDDPILVVHADRLPFAPLGERGVPTMTMLPFLYCTPPVPPSITEASSTSAEDTAPLALDQANTAVSREIAEGPHARTKSPASSESPASSKSSESPEWTGWGWLSRRAIMELPGDGSLEEIANLLIKQARANGRIEYVQRFMSLRSYQDLLDCNRLLLSGRASELLVGAREVETGVWLARNVVLHPTARLVRPVFIDANSRIGEGVVLGPNVVIGADCVVDSHCIVADSLIFAGSYLGEALEVTDSLVDRNRLVNVRLGAELAVNDRFLLGSLNTSSLYRRLSGGVARVIAMVLLLLGSPLLALVVFFLLLSRRGPVFQAKEVVRLPTSMSTMGWRPYMLWSFLPHGDGTKVGAASPWADLILRFWPQLFNVAAGNLNFVGVTPRSTEELRALPHDWQELYVRAKAGIITEAYVYNGSQPTEDELYTAEVFYSVRTSLRHDLTLLGQYLWNLWAGLPKRGEAISNAADSGIFEVALPDDTAVNSTAPKTPNA